MVSFPTKVITYVLRTFILIFIWDSALHGVDFPPNSGHQEWGSCLLSSVCLQYGRVSICYQPAAHTMVMKPIANHSRKDEDEKRSDYFMDNPLII